MNDGISIIICCYNSSTRIQKTLSYLAILNNEDNIAWEIILIDNNSDDDTVTIARDYWSQLAQPTQLKIFNEGKQGLTYARIRGIRESIYNYLIFCDDDNWLDKSYLERVYKLFSKNNYRLIGGWGIPITDVELPSWFLELDGFGYAVGKQSRKTGTGQMINGAGMAIRKSDAMLLVDQRFKPFLSDRKLKKLSSGGDSEIAVLMGRNFVFFDESLVYQHYLPAGRLNWEYFIRLNRAFGEGEAYLFFYKLTDTNRKIALKRYVIKILSTIRVYLILNIKLFMSRITSKETAQLSFTKSFLVTLAINLFRFSVLYSIAENNLKLFRLHKNVL